ncbi:MAG: hypothetical protein LBG58_03860 [Planctomycetaceae bacterium]|nr:hypothetical protein [Planctomycetaceae bacterium]
MYFNCPHGVIAVTCCDTLRCPHFIFFYNYSADWSFDGRQPLGETSPTADSVSISALVNGGVHPALVTDNFQRAAFIVLRRVICPQTTNAPRNR